jgi:hypothetical protein
MQSVVTHSDTEADAHPIQDSRDNQGLPTEHEERGDSADMQEKHDPACEPIKVAVIGFCRNLGH